MSEAADLSITQLTTPFDKRNFPATNQIHYCWYCFFSYCSLNYFMIVTRQKYNEYVLCLKKNDGDEESCGRARQLARSICVDEWVS